MYVPVPVSGEQCLENDFLFHLTQTPVEYQQTSQTKQYLHVPTVGTRCNNGSIYMLWDLDQVNSEGLPPSICDVLRALVGQLPGNVD